MKFLPHIPSNLHEINTVLWPPYLLLDMDKLPFTTMGPMLSSEIDVWMMLVRLSSRPHLCTSCRHSSLTHFLQRVAGGWSGFAAVPVIPSLVAASSDGPIHQSSRALFGIKQVRQPYWGSPQANKGTWTNWIPHLMSKSGSIYALSYSDQTQFFRYFMAMLCNENLLAYIWF